MLAYSLLAVYLDNVVSSGFGRVQKPWYLFLRSYWMPSTSDAASDTSTDVADDEAALAAMDDDVRAEMRRVLSTPNDADAIRAVNLKKVFNTTCQAACDNGGFTAVSRVNVGIEAETLFCLLGHNGAGKTTTFNMLSGVIEPSKGDAFVFGFSVKKQLRKVQSLMGICPQHDILWCGGSPPAP